MQVAPTYSFQLSRLLLRSLALFQGGKDRPAISSTSIEIRRRAEGLARIILVATDGRRLASYQGDIEQDSLFGEMPDTDHFLVDLGGIASLPKITGIYGDRVTVEVFEKSIEFVADSLRYTARRHESDVNFPDWRAIIPTTPPESLDQFAINYELLADFGKVAKWLNPDFPSLGLRSFGPGRPIAILLPKDEAFFGIIMPHKFDDALTVPEWLEFTQGEKPATPAAQPAAA